MKKKVTKNDDKRKMLIGIAMMIFAVAVSAGTYAYYQSTITGTASGTILAWSCKGNNVTSNFTTTLSNANLKPGVSGNFTITVTSANFAADYTIRITNVTNKPGNLKFYKTYASSTGYTEEMTVGATGTTAAGTIAAAANGSNTTTLYYNWPIGTSAETPLYTTANGSMVITFQLICTQKNTTPYGV